MSPVSLKVKLISLTSSAVKRSSDHREKGTSVEHDKTHGGNPYDGHLLKEAKENAEKNIRRAIERILVDRGFKKHEVENAEVLISYTRGLPRHLKRALRRRQAIEPWIGHMKQEGKLGRCHLKGQIEDQIHALLVAVGHNFRVILRRLRFFYAIILECVEYLLRVDEQKKEILSGIW